MKQLSLLFNLFLTVLLTCTLFIPCSMSQEDIPGLLVFEQTFENELENWYVVARNEVAYEFLGEESPEGFGITFLVTAPPTAILNNMQFTFEGIETPEDADIYPWRITFWIRVSLTPYTIRPIVAMSEDPWSGVSVDFPIESGENEWQFIDVTLDPGEFLTTDTLLFIFHMGNPGNEFGEYEVSFDEIKLYLLNETTGVNDWMIQN